MILYIFQRERKSDEKIIATWVSFGRSGLEAKSFLKKVKRACTGRLPGIFIDGGSWYPALNVVSDEISKRCLKLKVSKTTSRDDIIYLHP